LFEDLEAPSGEVSAEEAVEEEEEEPAREVVVAAPAAPWGALPVVFMLPCVVIMFLVGIMGFEMVSSMAGYRPPGMITKTVGGMLGVMPKQSPPAGKRTQRRRGVTNGVTPRRRCSFPGPRAARCARDGGAPPRIRSQRALW